MKTAAIVLSAFVALAVAEDDNACWLSSYGRGVGAPISVCADGLEQNGALCYPQCSDGYSGDGPVCWQNCPDGFDDTGADCLKPGSYGRGAGYVAWDGDKCKNENPQGCEENGLLWYPKCADNFHAVGCCVCSPDCPNGMPDIGVSCQKDSYGRGAGDVLQCTSDREEDAGLCYGGCSDGYHGVGPVCWGSCPDGLDECGALCVSSGQCASDILDMATKALQGVAETASAGAEGDIPDVVKNTAQTMIDLAGGLTHPICGSN